MCSRSGLTTYKNVLSQIDYWQLSGTDESLHTFSIGKQLETKSSHSQGHEMCDQQSLRSACAYAQSDQSIC